ncbi:F-box-like domain protein [Ceratobasidium sp. AG-Ba]|nr:F-box-like domain protein [Ceratobasidium sp. AG-Ba]
MLVRCWALYRQRWVLWVLSAGLIVNVVVSAVLVKVLIDNVVFVANPLPEVLSGCLVILPSYTWSIYILPMIYESTVFCLTVWKAWKIRKGSGATPLTRRLAENASRYFVVLLAISLFSSLGTTNPKLEVAANVSGIYSSLSSVVCSRVIISLYEFGTQEKSQFSASAGGTANSNPTFELPLSALPYAKTSRTGNVM